jgi:hypothetical protein
MKSALRSLGLALLALALLTGGMLLAYARWTRPASDADTALADGQFERALAGYAATEARFDDWPVTRQVFVADYDRVVFNELWLLYRLGRYDDTIDKAERAPAGASPHFWSGCALVRKAIGEKKPEARLGWLSRAEDELRHAVEAAPNDWDTKVNFELTSRLAAELRKQPKTPPAQLMELLRPPPPAKPSRRVG